MSHVLDDIDIKILYSLQQNGRKRRGELAEEVGLSLPSVSERLKKLQERGYLEGFTTVLNSRMFGFDVTAYARVTMGSSEFYQAFLEKVRETSEILECHAVTGEGSHLLKIRTRNTASLEKILSDIQAWPGVMSTLTSVVLSTHKETLSLPLHQQIDESEQ
jgi:Lrp/AsnC family transcriptional regulator, leucine-responsive regulatory protein